MYLLNNSKTFIVFWLLSHFINYVINKEIISITSPLDYISHNNKGNILDHYNEIT